MQSIKTAWVWILSFFFAVMLLLAVIIWQSYQPVTSQSVESQSAAGSQVVNDQESDSEVSANHTESLAVASDITGEPAADLPAPAKQLHNLLRDQQEIVLDDKALAARLASLNEQIDNLNKALAAEGLALPTEDEVKKPRTDKEGTDKQDTDIDNRLADIKSFMEAKEQGVENSSGQ